VNPRGGALQRLVITVGFVGVCLGLSPIARGQAEPSSQSTPAVEPTGSAEAPAPVVVPASEGVKTVQASEEAVAVDQVLKCRRGLDAPEKETPKEEEAVSAPVVAEALAKQEERKRHEEGLARYVEAAKDFREEVRLLVGDVIDTRRRFLNRGYEREVSEVELSERKDRLSAIARFERFIEKYPENVEHTPDAMFRLAELYFERTEIEYSDALEQFDVDQDLYDRGKIPSEPRQPEKNYAPSAAVYRALIDRFADRYRYIAAVHYLLGYVESESGREGAARDAWMALVTRYPDSEYAPEVRLRVGEMHFDFGEFEEAEAQYRAALRYPDSKFYDKALYKLAWTYFQLWDYDRAIKTFKRLIEWYDRDATGDGAMVSALREEAVEYLAKSLTEDDWDNDGLDDPDAGVARALSYLSDGTRSEHAVLQAYATSLFELHDQKKYKESILVYKELIRRSPLAEETPEHQRQIVKVYDILRDVENATVERERLAAMFQPGSRWYRANAENTRLIEQARMAVESAMRERALWHHQQAQEFAEKGRLEQDELLVAQAFEQYRAAARAYKAYLNKYPDQPASYEIRYYRAETLYFSNQFGAAAAAYAEVSSDLHNDRYREPAAWSTVKSIERLIKADVTNGRLSARALPGSDWRAPESDVEDGGTDVRKIRPEPIPKRLQNWIAAAKVYITHEFKRDTSGEIDAALSYQIAEMLYRYKHFNDARDRFEQVIACHPRSEVASLAAANIINSYREENDFANLERWADLAEKLDIGDPNIQKEIRSQIKVFKLGVQFKQAENLLQKKRYLEAAREFERLAESNQDASFADKAYFNAASAYKEERYYDSASRIFEKLVTDARYAKSAFIEESLFELAETYKLFFNFDKAVTAYKTLFERYPSSPNRPYVLFQSGVLQQNRGRWLDAARIFERYAAEFVGREDAAGALYRAAGLYEKLKDTGQQARVLESFLTRYRNTVGMETAVMRAILKLANLAQSGGKKKRASTLWGEVIREYQTRGLEPGTAAAVAAAEAHFHTVERKFRTFSGIRLKGTQKRMTADLTRKNKLLSELEEDYSKVLEYGALDWVIAASYRLGDIYDEFAKTLYAAPEPRGLNEDELDVFITMIEDEGLKYENIAIERYETTVQQSRRLKVTNAWAKRALKAINKYKPVEYPLFKEEKRRLSFEPLYSDHPPTVEVR
jgi:TolA-binding protein